MQHQLVPRIAEVARQRAEIARDQQREVAVQPERANRVGGIFVNETPPEQVAAELRRALATQG